ncbi:MAG: hypothetical protein E7378_03870 [Clostridiales bacterium]|nr:hypothetical protein [Clostridiales bacterium]
MDKKLARFNKRIFTYMQGMIKNYQKFSQIKLSPGKDLTHVPRTLRSLSEKQVLFELTEEFRATPSPLLFARQTPTIGASSKQYGDWWFEMPNGKAIFKTYDTVSDEIKNIRIINELICQQLCTQVGIRCARYEPAHINDEAGLISYSVLDSASILIPAEHLAPKRTEYNFISLLKKLKMFSNSNRCQINLSACAKDIFKIMVFDALTMQLDRNPVNLNFVFNPTDGSIKVAPLFDNELSFMSMIYGFEEFNSNEGDPDYQESALEFLDFTPNFFTVRNYYDKFLYHNFDDIVILAEQNPAFSKILQHIISKLNITKAIKQVEAMGFEINEEYKQYMSKIIQFTKSNFLKKLKQTQSYNNNPTKAREK